MLEAYGRGVAAYKAQAWGDAEQAFLAALAAMPGDGPSTMYLDRCRTFAAAPPVAGWDGVWTLKDK